MAVANLAGSGQALDSSLNTIYTEFRLLRDETGVARKCATHMKLGPHQGATKNVLNYGRLRAYALQDGVDMAQGQSLADQNTAYTPSEVGVQVVLPKSTLRRVADPQLLQRTGRMMNSAYDLKEDTDGVLQFPNFGPSVGGQDVVIRVGHILAATSRIGIGDNRAAPEPAPGPWYSVLHRLQLGVIAGRLIPLGDGSTGVYNPMAGTGGETLMPAAAHTRADRLLEKGPSAAGRLFDAEIFGDANIPVDANDNAIGGVFSKEALIYVNEVDPVMEPDETDASLRAVELNLWGSFVFGTYRPQAYGCEVVADASIPTS
jgi:hypothetical protein